MRLAFAYHRHCELLAGSLCKRHAVRHFLRLPSGHSPPTACRHTVAGTLSLPSQGFFSPFPHGTGSLSVAREYLALRDGPRRFPRDFTCPAVLRVPVGAGSLSSTGLSPSMADRSRSFD